MHEGLLKSQFWNARTNFQLIVLSALVFSHSLCSNSTQDDLTFSSSNDGSKEEKANLSSSLIGFDDNSYQTAAIDNRLQVNQYFSHQWAAHILGGIEKVKQLAEKHEFLYLGEVGYKVIFSFCHQ